MATYHLSLKNGAKGKGGPHALYIMRLGKFSKGEKGQQVIASGEINLPYWAKNSYEFFRAADIYERANGRSYSEFEIALPNELSLDENIRLVKDFIDKAIGSGFVISYAIHETNAALHEGTIQPHAHIMFSVRQMTDTPANAKKVSLFFKRYNKKCPERGGYAKDRRYTAKAASVKNLKEARLLWENLVNSAYQKNGIDKKISSKTLKEQHLEALDKGDTLLAGFFDRPKPMRLNLRQLSITRKKIMAFLESGKEEHLKIEQHSLTKLLNIPMRSALFLQQRLLLEAEKKRLNEHLLTTHEVTSDFNSVITNALDTLTSRINSNSSYIAFYNSTAFKSALGFEKAALDILTHGKTKKVRRLKDRLDENYAEYKKLKEGPYLKGEKPIELEELIKKMHHIQAEGNLIKAGAQKSINSLNAADVESLVRKLYSRQLTRLSNARRLENLNDLITRSQEKTISVLTMLNGNYSPTITREIIENIEVKALKLSTLPTLDFYNSTKLINELTEAMDIIIMKNRDRQDKETISRLTQKEQSIN